MKQFIETPYLLKSIKAEDLDDIYNYITNKAAEWAAGGYLTYANKLLQDLWAFHSCDYGNVRHHLEGLQIMWELSGDFPHDIPFPFRTVEDIEKENWFDVTFNNQYKGKQVLSILLNRLETDIQNTPGSNYGTLTAFAAILSLGNGLIPEGEKFIRYWGLGYIQNYNYNLGYLLRNRNTSALLLRGILSPVFGLTEEKCSSEYKALSAALKKRKQTGRTLVYGDQSWASMLKNISLLSIEQNPELLSEDMILKQWLGNDPALLENILAAEEKLGLQLPADYREFLSASNGFASYAYTSPKLLTVEEIDWLSVLDEDLADHVEQILEWEKDKYPGLSKKCLLVAGLYEEEKVLLFPTKENGWECWSLVLAGGCGEKWYPGFRYYMEYQLHFLDSGGGS